MVKLNFKFEFLWLFSFNWKSNQWIRFQRYVRKRWKFWEGIWKNIFQVFSFSCRSVREIIEGGISKYGYNLGYSQIWLNLLLNDCHFSLSLFLWRMGITGKFRASIFNGQDPCLQSGLEGSMAHMPSITKNVITTVQVEKPFV